MSDSTRRRPPILGPVILIGIGVLARMQNYGQLPGNFWQTIWQLWPILLVLLGVEIIIGQMRLPSLFSFILALAIIAGTIGGVVYLAAQGDGEAALSSGETERIEKDLQGVTSATVRLSFGAGALRVGAVSGSQIMVGDFSQARGQVQVDVRYSRSGGRGDLRVDLPENHFWPMLSSGRSNEWSVNLNGAIPLDLRIDAGMSTNDLDLSELKLSALSLDAGFSTSTIKLPRSGNYTAHINGGFTTTDVVIPEGVAARVTIKGGLSTVTVDESRFTRSGDTYTSSGYDTATNRVNLVIESGLSTIAVR